MTLTDSEYDERKALLEEIKNLPKLEHEKIFKLLKETAADFSENSNGIFFDISKLSSETFDSLKKYIEYSHTIRNEQANREKEMEELR
jgi:hypothetical protein